MSSFAQRFGKGLMAGMEDDYSDPIDDSVYVEHADNTADVDAGLAEIDSVMEDTNTLSALTDKAQEIQDRDGGLDETASEVLDIAVEAIYTRLGISRKPVLAMEGFADKNGKRNVNVALEGLGETLAKIWKAIKEAFLKMWNWIKSFFTSAESVGEKQKNTKASLKKELAEIKKSSSVGNEDYWNSQYAGDKEWEVKLTESEKNILFIGQASDGKHYELTLVENVESLIKDLANRKGEFLRPVDLPFTRKPNYDDFKGYSAPKDSLEMGNGSSGMVTYSYDYQIENTELVVHLPDSSLEGFDALKAGQRIFCSVKKYKDSKPGSEINSIHALQMGSIRRILDMKDPDFGKSKQIIAYYESTIKKLEQEIKYIQGEVNDQSEEDFLVVVKNNYAVEMVNMKFLTTEISLILKTTEVLLSIARKSLAKYKPVRKVM